MTAHICAVRDAIASAIEAATWDVGTINVSTEYLQPYSIEDLEQTRVTVNPAAQSQALISRGALRRDPILVIGVHRRVAVDGGHPDQTVTDSLIDFIENLTIFLLTISPKPYQIEIPQVFDLDIMREKGVFRCVILATYHTDEDV